MLDHTGGASGTTTLTWLAPLSPGTDRPVVYDTLACGDPAVWSPGGAQCLELGSDLTSVHEVTPPVGAVITFLVRAANYCGDGNPGAGVDTTGTELPRSARTCGCEHGICTVGPALDPGCDSLRRSSARSTRIAAPRSGTRSAWSGQGRTGLRRDLVLVTGATGVSGGFVTRSNRAKAALWGLAFLLLTCGTALADRGSVPEFTPEHIFFWEDTGGSLTASC